jgi:large subunit ribosomal protein L10
MDRAQKAEAVESLTATFNEAGVVVVTRNLGLSVAQSTTLRTRMRDAGAQFKVSKNTLAKLAIANTDYAGIDEMLVGPVALATSVDPVAAAKVAIDFAKTNDKLEIIGGSMGAQVLNAEGIKALASMPSLDQLRATLIGLVQAPATKIAQLTTAPAAKLARVFAAYAEKEAA